MSKKIVMLCSDCFSTRALYHHLSKKYEIERVIVEEPMRGAALAKRRLKKLGYIKVFGQVLFGMLIVPVLRALSKQRVNDIQQEFEMDDTPIQKEKIVQVASANDQAAIDLLKELNPDIVLVNGTRILSKKLLESTSAIFINMHTGITPRYRGVHGGYWAVVNNDPEHCGVTVHLVDKGIDTGGILYQKKIAFRSTDNFVTYPFLQFGEGIPLIGKAVEDVDNNQIATVHSPTTDSRLWYHPTITQYLYHCIFRGKK